jgi:hypothetical protein
MSIDRNSSMATGNEIEAGAKAIAEDLRLPGGGLKKLARVVEDHLDWFDAAEARGLTWADMSRLLFASGAKSRNGRPFSVGTLYSTVWRKREDAEQKGVGSSSKSVREIKAATHVASRKGRSDRAPKWKRNAEQPGKPRQVQRSSLGKPEIEKTERVMDSTEHQLLPTKSGKVAPRPSSKEDVMAFMQRSAAVRGFKLAK